MKMFFVRFLVYCFFPSPTENPSEVVKESTTYKLLGGMSPRMFAECLAFEFKKSVKVRRGRREGDGTEMS